MGNKQHASTSSFIGNRSPVLLLTLALLAFSLLVILFCLSSNARPPPPSPYLTLSTRPETSFVTSLERFLYRNPSPRVPDDTAREGDSVELDDRAFVSQSERLYGGRDLDSSPVRVYVYEMPRKFTYDLLWLFQNTYRDTDNLTSNGSPVHRLIEQHSVDYWLWADLIAPESERMLKSVVRVGRQEDADLFYVPFFTTISFFLMEKQQCKALYRVRL